MNRLSWKFLAIAAVVVVALSFDANQANAQWRGWYQPAAWSCCYTPCTWSCYTPCTVSCNSCTDGGWYLGWRPGPVRRLLLGRYRWYWGPTGWCCDTVYEPCCDSGTSTTPKAATPNQPTPAPTPAQKPLMPEPGPNAPAPEPSLPQTQNSSADAAGTLTVWVPSNAKVTVNGRETSSTGNHRQFVSYGLKPGFSYKYVVKAVVVRDGQMQEDTRTVTLTAGQTTAVAFSFNGSAVANLAMAN